VSEDGCAAAAMVVVVDDDKGATSELSFIAVLSSTVFD
jgi:hypothetical protein